MTGLEHIRMLNGKKVSDNIDKNYIFIVSNNKDGILNVYDSMQKAKDFLANKMLLDKSLTYKIIENDKHLFIAKENESGAEWQIKAFIVL